MAQPDPVRDKGTDMADLIRQLRHAPALLAASVAGLSPDDLAARPIAGKWSIAEVVEHVALVGLGWTNILFEAIGGVHDDNPRNRDPAWSAAEEVRAKLGVAEAIDVYERNNRRVADYLAALAPGEWTRKFPAVQWLPCEFEIRDHLHWGIVGHLHHHLRFIREKRIALGKPAPE